MVSNIVLSSIDYNVVGKRPIRHDGYDKVTGKAQYGADIQLPAIVHDGFMFNNAYYNGAGIYFGDGDGVNFTDFAADDTYSGAAETIGLDVEQYKKDFADPSTAKLIKDEMAEARTAGVRGTPTIFINGKKPQGRSLELYKGIIDGILKGKS